MAKNGPNKTVAAARRKMGGFPIRPKEITDPFMLWIFEQARAGASYSTIEEARAAFDARPKED